MNLRKLILTSLSFFSFASFCQANLKESYIVLDSVSGKVFFANFSELKRPVASLTKVATAKVTLDWVGLTGTNLSTRFLVPQSATQVTGANPLNLQPGDSLSLRDALYASLLGSDNKAAHSLANFVGYSLNQKRGVAADPIVSFVKEMNRLCGALNMKNTTFVNPHGLDTTQAKGTSTATDIALLSMAAIKNEALAFIVKQQSRTISVKRSNGKVDSYTLKNTNTLLGKNGVVGLKTGYTSAAGQCLITIADKQTIVTEVAGKKRLRPRQLVIVMLGSNDRFGKSLSLIQQGWTAYDTWGKSGYLVPSSGKGLLRLPESPNR